MATILIVNDRINSQNTTTSIPRIGFGSYRIRGQACTTAVLAALSAGYRHIDSAALYRNEESVHNAIEQSGLDRDDLFITTKAGSPRKKTGSGEEYQDVIESVDRIAGVDGYVDLLLMHVPGPSRSHRQRIWAVMERAKKEGRAKSIGVSNFQVRHLEELREYATEWPPSVNQIELHPWCQQRDVVAYCQTNDIVVEAYSPLATGARLDDTTVQSISTKHGKTPAQILIHYSLQKGWVPLPKSSNSDRIQENIDVFDFALDHDDMGALDALDEGSAGAVFRKNVD
ncbi:hypothetical protein FSARC_4339 [Fusarium sarcochroum]|uniref:NADP-dependent oxidoreductase domain-containing protein n=1 Tax=Fusarium sarcochroum TaxID=1208366 RepID=A0A8H4U1W2_9HYPO|nr:hypothetical protein FSARC_4339 [Fusarium sarcochroum]